MKNIYTLIVLICCSFSFSTAQIVPPYFNDFETNSIGWYPDGTPGNIWQWDTTNIGAGSGVKAWGIRLDSSGLSNPGAALYSPVFDFTTISNATLSFWQNFDTDLFNSGTRIEYSVSGSQWTLLDDNAGPANSWYNSVYISSSGLPGWTGYLGSYIYSSASLNNLSGFAAVQFRFVFNSSTPSPDAYIIDDFCIGIPSYVCNNSVGINPLSYSENSFSVFPNPAKDMFTIETKSNSDFNISLYDLVGKEILSKNMNGAKTIIETKNICSGIYFLKISDEEKQFLEKLIIEND